MSSFNLARSCVQWFTRVAIERGVMYELARRDVRSNRIFVRQRRLHVYTLVAHEDSSRRLLDKVKQGIHVGLL